MFLEVNSLKTGQLSILEADDSSKINEIKKEINFYSLKVFLEIFKKNETKKII